MLATLGTAGDLTAGDAWAYEMKWDGVRVMAFVRDGTVRLVSRNDIDMTVTYPELAELVDVVDGDAVLDGEIVALDPRGRSNFGRLQTRMKLTKPGDVARAMQQAPVHLMLFDLLEHDGRSLRTAPYDERRAALEAVVHPTARGRVQVPPSFDGDVEDALADSRELGFEGILAKRRDAPYQPGVRSPAWIKIKHHKVQEVVVGGFRAGKGRRANGIGSLLMGIPDGDELRYVGRVGTGFTDRQLDELQQTLGPLVQATSPLAGVPRADAKDAHWVTPSLVGEVEFAEWTKDDRLRQPSWRGWRPDKSPDDVVRES